LKEEAEASIQTMIKNNLKSKKNKRTKVNDDTDKNKNDKIDSEDTFNLDKLFKQNISQECGGVIIDHDHNEDENNDSLTYKDLLKMSNSKKKTEPKSMPELLSNINSVDNDH